MLDISFLRNDGIPMTREDSILTSVDMKLVDLEMFQQICDASTEHSEPLSKYIAAIFPLQRCRHSYGLHLTPAYFHLLSPSERTLNLSHIADTAAYKAWSQCQWQSVQ